MRILMGLTVLSLVGCGLNGGTDGAGLLSAYPQDPAKSAAGSSANDPKVMGLTVDAVKNLSRELPSGSLKASGAVVSPLQNQAVNSATSAAAETSTETSTDPEAVSSGAMTPELRAQLEAVFNRIATPFPSFARDLRASLKNLRFFDGDLVDLMKNHRLLGDQSLAMMQKTALSANAATGVFHDADGVWLSRHFFESLSTQENQKNPRLNVLVAAGLEQMLKAATPSSTAAREAVRTTKFADLQVIARLFIEADANYLTPRILVPELAKLGFQFPTLVKLEFTGADIRQALEALKGREFKDPANPAITCRFTFDPSRPKEWVVRLLDTKAPGAQADVTDTLRLEFEDATVFKNLRDADEPEIVVFVGSGTQIFANVNVSARGVDLFSTLYNKESHSSTKKVYHCQD